MFAKEMIEPKIVINEIGMGSACKIITTHIIVLFLIDILLSVFYRQFRLCITKAQGKAHTPL
jgi:hypothetical protein